MRCDADHLFDRMFALCERLESGKLGTDETVELRRLYDEWIQTNCGAHGCQRGRCRFRVPDVYWIEKNGLTDLADFLWHCEQEDYDTRLDGKVTINRVRADALDRAWPGSYGSRQ
jgi:hypothetical protein